MVASPVASRAASRAASCQVEVWIARMEEGVVEAIGWSLGPAEVPSGWPSTLAEVGGHPTCLVEVAAHLPYSAAAAEVPRAIHLVWAVVVVDADLGVG